MDKEKLMNISWFLASIPYVAALIFGILYAVTGTIQFYHESYIGLTPEDISSFNPELMILISLFIRVMGCLFMSIGIVGIFVIYFGYKKEQKMSWAIIFFTSFLGLVPLAVETFIIAGWGFPFPIVLICLICWISAIGINMIVQGET